MSPKNHRRMRNTERVILDAVARGRTTVLTAEPIAAITIAAPAITARILRPTARGYARAGYSTAAGTGSSLAAAAAWISSACALPGMNRLATTAAVRRIAPAI